MVANSLSFTVRAPTYWMGIKNCKPRYWIKESESIICTTWSSSLLGLHPRLSSLTEHVSRQTSRESDWTVTLTWPDTVEEGGVVKDGGGYGR